jgi:HPt (histidine-containing phosphotransfer) domain-containing protein
MKILRKFRDDFRNAGDMIRDLVSSDGYDEAERMVHSIKGVSGNLGADELSRAAESLEKCFKNGERGLPEQEYRTFLKALDRVLTSISNLDIGDRKEQKDGDLTAEPFTEEQKIRVTKLLNTILDLLKANDTEAADRIEELMTTIQGRVTQGALTEVQRLVEGWDFDKAVDRLREMAAQINIDIED